MLFSSSFMLRRKRCSRQVLDQIRTYICLEVITGEIAIHFLPFLLGQIFSTRSRTYSLVLKDA